MAKPSAFPHRLVIALLAFVAAAISTSLALYQYHAVPRVWDPLPGNPSRAVLASHISIVIRQWTHVPDAAMGSAAYVLECILALIGSDERWREQRGLVLVYGAVAAALAAGGITLTALQLFVIHALCVLCLTTAAISVIVFALSLREVLAAWRT